MAPPPHTWAARLCHVIATGRPCPVYKTHENCPLHDWKYGFCNCTSCRGTVRGTAAGRKGETLSSLIRLGRVFSFLVEFVCFSGLRLRQGQLQKRNCTIPVAWWAPKRLPQLHAYCFLTRLWVCELRRFEAAAPCVFATFLR